MPRQLRIYQGISVALMCADAFALMRKGQVQGGFLARAFQGLAFQSLPARVLDWFDAELSHPGVLDMTGWPALFGNARAIVAATEITEGEVLKWFDGGRHNPPGEALTEIASICTINAIEAHYWKRSSSLRERKERAERKRDRQAVTRLQNRLPEYIRKAHENHEDARVQRYQTILDLLHDWPAYPSLRKSFDWHFAITEIANAYEQSMGSPAPIKFLAAAAKRTLQITKTDGALEKAISRTRRFKEPRRAAERRALRPSAADQRAAERRLDEHYRKSLQDPENRRQREAFLRKLGIG